MKPQQCRYLRDGYCLYHDDSLRGNEDIKCYPGGWDCYEAPNDGIIYENGKWMTMQEYADWVIEDRKKRLPEGFEYTIPDIAQVEYSSRPCPVCNQPLQYVEGQPRIVCPCGAMFELSE